MNGLGSYPGVCTANKIPEIPALGSIQCPWAHLTTICPQIDLTEIISVPRPTNGHHSTSFQQLSTNYIPAKSKNGRQVTGCRSLDS